MTPGMSCLLPLPMSATPGSPSSGANTASVPSAFHAYDAKIQRSAVARQINRVSALRPLKLNSFQNFVPTGNAQSPGTVVSIAIPGGREIQRTFDAPSDQ